MPLRSDVFIVDIESDNLSATYDESVRVYLIGMLNFTTNEVEVFKNVSEFSSRLNELGNPYLVFHNASFDVPALRLRGCVIPSGNYFCTMVGSHTLHPESSDFHSLGTLQPQTKRSLKQRLDDVEYQFPPDYKKNDEYTYYGKHGEFLDSIVEQYLILDLEATALEYKRQMHEYTLTPAKTLDVLLNVNIPYIERIISMEAGMRVEYDESIANSLSEVSVTAYNECLRIAGYIGNPTPFRAGLSPYTGAGFKAQGEFCKMEPFNPNSSQQVANTLKRLYDWSPLKQTKNGAPSVSSEVLEALDYPLTEHLLAYSKSTKLLTFCSALEGTTWVRPSYNQCATRTTRLSSSQPNIQNIPARDKVGKQLRKMFTARDGYTLLVGDQSGLV